MGGLRWHSTACSRHTPRMLKKHSGLPQALGSCFGRCEAELMRTHQSPSEGTPCLRGVSEYNGYGGRQGNSETQGRTQPLWTLQVE